MQQPENSRPMTILVAEALLSLGEATSIEIAAHIDASDSTVRSSLERMRQRKEVRRCGTKYTDTGKNGPRPAKAWKLVVPLEQVSFVPRPYKQVEWVPTNDPTVEEIYAMAAELRAKRHERGAKTKEDFVPPVGVQVVGINRSGRVGLWSLSPSGDEVQ